MSFTIQRILGIAPSSFSDSSSSPPRRGSRRCQARSRGELPRVAAWERAAGGQLRRHGERQEQWTGAAGASVTKFCLVPAVGAQEEPQGRADRRGPRPWRQPGAAGDADHLLRYHSRSVFPSGLRQPRRHGGGGNHRHRREQLSDRRRDHHRPRRAGSRDEDDQRAAVAGAAGARLRRDLQGEEHGGCIRARVTWSSSLWCRPSSAYRPESI